MDDDSAWQAKMIVDFNKRANKGGKKLTIDPYADGDEIDRIFFHTRAVVADGKKNRTYRYKLFEDRLPEISSGDALSRAFIKWIRDLGMAITIVPKGGAAAGAAHADDGEKAEDADKPDDGGRKAEQKEKSREDDEKRVTEERKEVAALIEKSMQTAMERFAAGNVVAMQQAAAANAEAIKQAAADNAAAVRDVLRANPVHRIPLALPPPVAQTQPPAAYQQTEEARLGAERLDAMQKRLDELLARGEKAREEHAAGVVVDHRRREDKKKTAPSSSFFVRGMGAVEDYCLYPLANMLKSVVHTVAFKQPLARHGGKRQRD